MSTIALALVTIAALGGAGFLAWQLFNLRSRVRPIVDIDAELDRVRREIATAKNNQVAIQIQAEKDRQKMLDDAKAEVGRIVTEQAAIKIQAEKDRQSLLDDTKAEAGRIIENGKKTLVEQLASIETQKSQASADVEQLKNQKTQAEKDFNARRDELNTAYTTAHETFEQLRTQIALLEENAEDISYGIYTPHYGFGTSTEYEKKLDDLYQRQKAAIRDGSAVRYGVAWSIGDSRKEGERMQKQYGKLMLRAFNGECDAAVARVAWNNITKMEERIKNAFDAIGALGGVMQISLTPSYLDLQLEELRLSYELEQKKRAEDEEERRIRARAREEEKVQKELEQTRKKAEREEAEHQAALTKARAELATANHAEVGQLNDRIQQLEQQLADATKEKERAISMAQQTRAGHVYIISNIGSFGENVLKIGLTRRIDPMERIKELGDAAVPFSFDYHGKIWSNDAPALEHEIHTYFDAKRMNRANARKEFFQITLDEMQGFLKHKGLEVELLRMPEAREYRETLSLREKLAAMADAANSPKPSPFPASPFA